jgi:hypothetical protein
LAIDSFKKSPAFSAASPLVTSTTRLHSTSLPIAYVKRLSGTANPLSIADFGRSASAERNTSNGAPCVI